MWIHAVQAVQCPATFQKLMQSFLGELNLTYCIICLDNVIVFLKMEEEHFKYLHVVFDCFQEHNLRPEPTKCVFFWDEINYLAHHVSKKHRESKSCSWVHPPQTYMEIWVFLGLVGYYGQFIKGFAHIMQTSDGILLQEGAHKKSKWVTLMAEAKDAFETLKKACLEAPVLAFGDFDKPFLLETDTSKLGLGAVNSIL